MFGFLGTVANYSFYATVIHTLVYIFATPIGPHPILVWATYLAFVAVCVVLAIVTGVWKGFCALIGL